MKKINKLIEKFKSSVPAKWRPAVYMIAGVLVLMIVLAIFQ